jgi:C4-dicarboxylate transporter, DctM subunit
VIATLRLTPLALIALLTLMHIVLGMISDIRAMVILTIPIVFPVIVPWG